MSKTLDEALWRHGALTQLAKKLGVSRSYLCDVRKGRAKPSVQLAERIARETGVSVEDIGRTEAA